MFLSCVSKGLKNILVPNLPLICGYINTKQETSALVSTSLDAFKWACSYSLVLSTVDNSILQLETAFQLRHYHASFH